MYGPVAEYLVVLMPLAGYQDYVALSGLGDGFRYRRPAVRGAGRGVDRAALFFLIDAYAEVGDRLVLKLHPKLAPYKAAVFPLLKNKPELVAKAREVFTMLRKSLGRVQFDDNGNIGKRYRRQDEIGTPYCVTVDFDTLGEKPELKDTVTLRDRDTGKQERIAIGELVSRFGAS